MNQWMALLLALAFLPSVWADSYKDHVLEETLYQDFKQALLSKKQNKKMFGFSAYEQSLFVDAVWDLADEGQPAVLDKINDSSIFHYELIERLRIAILRIKYKRALVLPEPLVNELTILLNEKEVDTKIIYTLAAYEQDILASGHEDIIALAKNHLAYFDISEDEVRKKEITNDVVADLFNNSPDVTTYMNGEYVKSVKIFMFCRESRLYPCLMVMRNIYGEVVRNADGTIWNHPSLASSARGLPSYTRNGNTPAGIMTIDSVMPVADQQISFGKFRRMMLNFVPKSQNEVLSKALLPVSSHNTEWWKAANAARDVGRNLFRIHGTGKVNNDPTTPYYPFMRTSGCIAQRENTYGNVTYRDQRVLLDDVMKAMDMVPTYENEVRVKGILYLMDIDDQNSPVTIEELALRGIE